MTEASQSEAERIEFETYEGNMGVHATPVEAPNDVPVLVAFPDHGGGGGGKCPAHGELKSSNVFFGYDWNLWNCEWVMVFCPECVWYNADSLGIDSEEGLVEAAAVEIFKTRDEHGVEFSKAIEAETEHAEPVAHMTGGEWYIDREFQRSLRGVNVDG